MPNSLVEEQLRSLGVSKMLPHRCGNDPDSFKSRGDSMQNRKLSFVAAGIALAMTMAACAGGGAGSNENENGAEGNGAGSEVDTSDMTVGVAMPTQSMQRWLDDGNNMKAELEAEGRSEEHTSELQSRGHLVCRLLLEKKKERQQSNHY